MFERIVVPIEWKASSDEQTLEGYASTFGNVDLGGDVVVKGAFAKTIANIRANGIPLLADHMPSTTSVLGTIYDATEDERGLKIKARFSKAPSAQDVRTKLLEGHLTRMSIGYEAMDYAFEDRESGRVRLLKEVKLWETSVVVFPMNPEAAVSRVKSMFDALDDVYRKSVLDALSADADPEDSPAAVPGDATPDEGAATATDPVATDGDEPEVTPDEGAGWDTWKSRALLAGHDPEQIADSAQVAGLRTRLELMESALTDELTAQKEN